jgi:hypothetical protein
MKNCVSHALRNVRIQNRIVRTRKCIDSVLNVYKRRVSKTFQRFRARLHKRHTHLFQDLKKA